ncbi:MAG: hypothetical protein V1750_07155 [Acidobacteriota bacterium]
MLSAVIPALAMACFIHSGELDLVVGERALPWLPPDLARQVVRRRQDWTRGATQAAAWPAHTHQPGAADGLEATLIAQCERLAEAVREHQSFDEVVAGLGALAHLALDLASPFAADRVATPHSQAFAAYLAAAAPRIPIVYYAPGLAAQPATPAELLPYLAGRQHTATMLASLVREDLDRVGGPTSWRRLDDRSTSFGAASLTLNHAASIYSFLAAWVWRRAGGLVPEIATVPAPTLLWKGEPKPRETPRPRLGFRQAPPRVPRPLTR